MTREKWFAQLAREDFREPDALLMKGMADWLEEHSEQDLADALRWMVGNRHFPRPFSSQEWVWYDYGVFVGTDPDPDDLPREVFDELSGGELRRTHRAYFGMSDAVEALARALARFHKGVNR